MAGLRPWRGALQLASRQLQGSAGLICPAPAPAPAAARDGPGPAAAPPLAAVSAPAAPGGCSEGVAGARGAFSGARNHPSLGPDSCQPPVAHAPRTARGTSAQSSAHTHTRSHSNYRVERSLLSLVTAQSAHGTSSSSQVRGLSIGNPTHALQSLASTLAAPLTLLLRGQARPTWPPHVAAAPPAPVPVRTARPFSSAAQPPSPLAFTPRGPFSAPAAAAAPPPPPSPPALAPSPLRPFSAASGGVPAAILEEDVVPRATKRRKNLFDLLWRNPEWGIGARVAKRHWAPGTFYQVTRVKINKSGRTGTAWGIYHEDGAPMSAELRMGGVNKACWKQLRDVERGGHSSSSEGATPKIEPEA